MKISELLSGRLPITINDGDSLALALQAMIWGDIRHLPVLHQGRLVGVITERDVLREYARVGRGRGGQQLVGAAMKSPAVTATYDQDVETALGLVTERGIGCLPIVDGPKLIDVLTRTDLLRHQLEEVVLPPKAGSRLTVDDIMSADPVTVAPDDPLLEVLERMDRHGVRHLPVIGGDRHVIGILSDRDVRTALGNPLRSLRTSDAVVRISSTRVADVMTRNPITLPAGTPIARLVALFADHKIGAVPILDSGERLVGIVSYIDLLRAAAGRKAAPN